MAGNPWGKFYWSDWQSDPALRLCSMAAQGFWMRLLCIAAEADPVGYVVIAGRALDNIDLSRLVGLPVSEVDELVAELERNAVFSRDRAGRIFSRRMRKDAEISKKRAINGKKGGLASLGKRDEIEVCSSKIEANAEAKPKPQKPEARSQIESNKESSPLLPREPAVSAERSQPQPQATDSRNPANSRSTPPAPDSRTREVNDEVMRLARMAVPPSDMHRVAAWLEAGADPETHIYPVVTRLADAMAKRGGTISTYKYLEPAVLEAVRAADIAADVFVADLERRKERLAHFANSEPAPDRDVANFQAGRAAP